MLELRDLHGVVSTLSLEEFEAGLRSGRYGPETPVRFEPVTGTEFVPAGSLEMVRSVVDGAHARFVRRFDLRRFQRVTVSAVVLLAAVFTWQTIQSPVLNGASLIEQGAKSMPHQVELGEWWRLASASLLHSGWLHLVPNLLFLAYVGWNVEAILGARGMVVLLVAS